MHRRGPPREVNSSRGDPTTFVLSLLPQKQYLRNTHRHNAARTTHSHPLGGSMRLGTRSRLTASHFRTATLLFAVGCAPTTPILLVTVPPRAESFSLGDSAEVVRRVQQVFSCSTAPNALPYGTLGFRRDSTFVDITVMQDLQPAGPDGEPSQICWKGFRVDTDGRIFVLPVKDWPYTAFRKKPVTGPRL